MDKKLKRAIMTLIAFAIVLFAVVMNIGQVWDFVSGVVKLILPIVVGLIIAFVLNVPMSAFARLFDRMFKKAKKKPNKKIINVICLFLTILCILIVVSVVGVLAVPEIVESVKSIFALLKQKIPELISLLEKYNIDTSKATEWLATLDENGLIGKITSGAGVVLVSVMNFATQTVSGIVSFIFASVIAIYVLISKDTVKRHSKKLLYVTLKKDIADKVCDVSHLTCRLFAQYLSGQCIEACILGALITISFLIFRLPYAGIIGIMTGLSAFIPYVGAFAACFIGAFLILLVSPMQALISIIVFCVIQFIETQFIYPHVVGNSVGLTPLLTLIAALVGGKLMGLFGIVFFIPLTAVVYTLLKEYTDSRLAEKKIKIE
ncbi:MAG: AI-2E family transporter [Ruminococcaceae bacterium]|nr:AI-2E family transporter [Oscillospiraceae bacterium]